MDVPYKDFLSSDPFQFLIGPDKKLFYVHSALVAKQSRPLAALVSNGMVESRQRCAVFDDVDEDTFLHFLEFAYTGEYTVPPPAAIPEPAENVVDEPSTAFLTDNKSPFDPGTSNAGAAPAKMFDQGEDDSIDIGLPGLSDSVTQTLRAMKKRRTNRRPWFRDEEAPAAASQPEVARHDIPKTPKLSSELWDEFSEAAHVNEIPSWKPRVNVGPWEDYSVVFLCHAKVYVFSDRYTISALRDLALQKLRLTLTRYTLFETRTDDIVELVKYIYSNTVDMNNGMDRLRALVMDYLVCHVEIIVKDKNFLAMLQEPGALAKDLTLNLLPRLSYG
ncbi:hypothetical protein H2204_004587 [Knufia peltigerae]|uniref:BTB domain-containing protein n=1 Tax=Knufia peltigerae TaxID=1002370 RepID=A0AA38Y748_9EURO|nr:hypothetical protein H2204_004587 [Knufia peltigerae]